MYRRHRLGGEVKQDPCDIVRKLFIVSESAIPHMLLFEDSSPPIHKYHNVKESIDAKSIKGIPPTANLTRDFAKFERPPAGLDGSPPCDG